MSTLQEETAEMYARSQEITRGMTSVIRNLEKDIRLIDEMSGTGNDVAYEKLLQQPEFAEEARARVEAEQQKMQKIRDTRRRRAEAHRKKKDAEEAAAKAKK